VPLTYNLKGSSTAPDATIPIPEWNPARTIRNPAGPMPWASWPFDDDRPSTGGLISAVIEEPPSTDPFPGSEIRRNTRVSSLDVKEGSDGDGNATDKGQMPTITQGNGSDLTVNLIATHGKVTRMTVSNNAGTGYEMGDTVTVLKADSGTTHNVVGIVTGVLL